MVFKLRVTINRNNANYKFILLKYFLFSITRLFVKEEIALNIAVLFL